MVPTSLPLLSCWPGAVASGLDAWASLTPSVDQSTTYSCPGTYSPLTLLPPPPAFEVTSLLRLGLVDPGAPNTASSLSAALLCLQGGLDVLFVGTAVWDLSPGSDHCARVSGAGNMRLGLH